MTGLVIVGDVLLDRDVEGSVERIAPDAPVPVVDQVSERSRPGGAGLAALLAARDGIETTIVTAIGHDDAGEVLCGLLREEGVEIIDLGTTAPTPEKVRIRCDGHSVVRLDRAGKEPGRLGEPPAIAHEAIHEAGTVLVSDYGRGITFQPSLNSAIQRAARQVPLVWDPHPRGGHPVNATTVVTPNAAEVSHFARTGTGDGVGGIEGQARRLMARWGVSSVAVTLGERGALFVDGGAHPLLIPAPPVVVSDPCGAGDRFATSMSRSLLAGLLPSAATTQAVIDSAEFVATGGAAGIDVRRPGSENRVGPISEAALLAARVRDRGGTVVATGGCFDIIHPGHVALLESARRLGDCLIVCVNSDRSVGRLKGPGRPVNRSFDRVSVLNGLASVDAVEVFDSDTPHDALLRIQPHLWVKGGDYGSSRLPEADLVESWGGEVVILPYMRGHSTSEILARAKH